MAKLETLEQRVARIEMRNKRVELDKAWETSMTRRVLILVITYLLIGTYMSFIKVKDPWLNAIVPAVGFLISTLVLSFARKLWQNQQ